jgi:hypothetical protein
MEINYAVIIKDFVYLRVYELNHHLNYAVKLFKLRKPIYITDKYNL